MTWPKPEELGLQKGEIFCYMAKPPEQLPPEELEELELRAQAILNRRGKRDESSKNEWRRLTVRFGTPYLLVQNTPLSLEIRVCDGVRHKDGIMLYTLAWEKRKADNKINHVYKKAKAALQHLRDLMVLDDLAFL